MEERSAPWRHRRSDSLAIRSHWGLCARSISNYGVDDVVLPVDTETAAPRATAARPLLWRARMLLRLRLAQCRALLRNYGDSSGLLVAAAPAVIVLGCVDYAFEAFAPMPPGCPRSFYQGIGVPHACVPAFRHSYAFVVARCMVAASCLLAIWLQRVYRLMRMNRARRQQPGQAGGCSEGPADAASRQAWTHPSFYRDSASDGFELSRNPRASLGMVKSVSGRRPWGSGSAGWTVAPSRQAWLETVGAVYSSVAAMLCSMLVIMTTVTAVYMANALPDSSGRSATGASWDYACATCTDYSAATSAFPSREAAVSECASTGKATALNVCFLTWHARMPMMLISGHVSSLAMVTVLTPLRVWGPVAIDAGEATGQRWLHVLRILHLLLIPAVVQCFIPFFALFTMEFYLAPRLLVEVSGYSSVIFVGPEVALSLWFLWAGRQNRRAGNAVAPGGPVTDAPRASAGKGLRQRVWAACRAVYDAILLESASGLNCSLQYMIGLILLVWSIPTVSYGAGFYAFLTAVTAGLLSWFMLTRDRPVRFEDLARDPRGVGCGLVVDACLLADAVQHHLEGAAPIGHLRTYKATVYRMEATLAVSYRWQDTEVEVCPGLALNMSQWQMEQLLAALRDTTCFYVWIDRLSVPQKASELQNTLLSRMMATYASARETLVLRSLEKSGSRYHQRAWTLPEFACSTATRVCTFDREDDVGGAAEDQRGAFTQEEELLVGEVREYYREHVAHIRPLWLLSSGEELESTRNLSNGFKSGWELYMRVRLRGLLNCTVRADRVRATYPLFFCAPVEDHTDLCHLAEAVADAMEAYAPGSSDARMARRNLTEVVGASVDKPTRKSRMRISVSR
eukprot:jgi/Tetstr1/457792/TSEL_044337.t1